MEGSFIDVSNIVHHNNTMKKKIILDVDTGSDDAIALMLSLLSPEIEVEAICTVWGNVSIEHATDNTLRLLSKMDYRIPVYAGMSAPIAKYLYEERKVESKVESEIDGEVVKMHDDQFDLPESKYKKEELPAPFFYIEYLSNAERPIDIVATGPLSNLGFAFSLRPDLVSKVKSLTIMGGGYNVTNVGTAEANFWNDPEAAQIVLDSGVKPTLVPLDATHVALITKDEIERLRQNDNFHSRFAADLLHQRMILHSDIQPLDLPNSATVHDALAVATLIDSAVLQEVKDVNCTVCFAGTGEGHCVIDRRESPNKSNCKFAFSADRERFVNLLIETYANN